ncbi:hypothetical protein ABEV00_28640 [Paenibacillus thiaminolyticus]
MNYVVMSVVLAIFASSISLLTVTKKK